MSGADTALKESYGNLISFVQQQGGSVGGVVLVVPLVLPLLVPHYLFVVLKEAGADIMSSHPRIAGEGEVVDSRVRGSEDTCVQKKEIIRK